MFMNNLVSKVKAAYADLGRKIGAMHVAPTKAQAQMVLFALGVSLLTLGMIHGASAQGIGPGLYNDDRIAEIINRMFLYLEGSFGALVMVVAGIMAVFAAALGSYKMGLGLLIVAVGAFILRSLVSTFFNDANIDPGA
jgi:hypothetical protein